jgi:hypothetical protein
VRVRRAGGDHEEVRGVAETAQVEHQDVLRLAVRQRPGRPTDFVQGGLLPLSAPGADLFLASDGGLPLG